MEYIFYVLELVSMGGGGLTGVTLESLQPPNWKGCTYLPMCACHVLIMHSLAGRHPIACACYVYFITVKNSMKFDDLFIILVNKQVWMLPLALKPWSHSMEVVVQSE
jgi:hypothetical protein